jgi:hypothetical protein
MKGQVRKQPDSIPMRCQMFRNVKSGTDSRRLSQRTPRGGIRTSLLRPEPRLHWTGKYRISKILSMLRKEGAPFGEAKGARCRESPGAGEWEVATGVKAAQMDPE